MPDQKLCNHQGCQNAATHQVVLELKSHPHHSPALSSPLVFVCSEHKAVAWADVVDARGWRTICENFASKGYAKPQMRYSNVRVQLIGTPS